MTIKNEKAFTLMELMVIVVLLIIVAALVLPQIGKMFDRRKEVEYENVSTSIENAAKQYVSENYKMGVDKIPDYLALYDLMDKGYVKDSIVDPRNGENLSENLIVQIINDEDDVLVYNLSDDMFVPSVEDLKMTSNNNINNIYARNGSIITVNITFSQKITNTPTVTINGRNATVTGNGNKRVATYTIPSNESKMLEGQMTVLVSNYTDKFNITGEPFSEISPGGIVVYDRTPPIFSSFYIGGTGNPNNIMSTNTILSSSVSGANQMCMSTSKNKTCNTWKPYASQMAYKLSSGDGVKTLYVAYRDYAGNTTKMYSDSITLDTTPPTYTYFYIGGNGNPSYLTFRDTTLYISAIDATDMCISTSTICSAWEPYNISKTYIVSSGDGIKTLYIKFRDNVGNITSTYNDSILLDTTPPICASSGGSSTWRNTNLTLKGTCTDDGSGCSLPTITKTYSTNINSTKESPGVIKDNAGNSTTCASNQTVRIDKIAPICTSSGGSSTWRNADLTLTGTCSDTGGSGCNSSTITKTYSTNINSTKESPGIVKDNAGNSTTCASNQIVMIDKTAPTCTSSGGSSTWRNTNLTLKGTCSDGGSGCSLPTITKIYSTNINSIKESPGVVKDKVGNSTTCASNQTVRIDKTAPTCTSGGGSSTWRNTDLTLTGTCTDTGGSGCVKNTSKTYSSNTNSTTESPGTVSDNAGNTAICASNQIVKIDKTSPTCTSSGGSSTWRNTDLTLTGTCSDTGGSGCSSSTITKIYSTDINSTKESPGIVKDNAGNSATCTSNQTVMIDKVAPSCTSSGGNSTWRNTNLTLTGTCSDGGSGCSSSTITKTYSTDINSITESPGVVKDKVGNSTTCPSNQTVKIDKTVPTCTSSGGSSTWRNTDLTLTGTCSDGGSGCSSSTITKTYSTNINSATESPGVIKDKVGNSTTCAFNQTVRIDKTVPTCTSSGGSSTWRNTDLTLTGTCSDVGGSGCTKNASKTYSSNTNSTTQSPGSVTDNAGNSATCPLNQTVRIDKTAPTCTSSGGNSTWRNTDLTLTGTCADTGGSGCILPTTTKTYSTNTNSTTESAGIIKDNAGNSAACPSNQTVRIDKTAPTCTSSGGNSTWRNTDLTLTGACSDTGGSGCVKNATKTYSSNTNSTTQSPGSVTDNAGNSATCPSNQTVRIDKTAPTCTSSGGSSTWRNTDLTLTGACSDTGGSGCIKNATKPYSSNTNSTTESPGTVTDNAGNSATCPSNQTVRIDKTAPTCTSSGGNSTWRNTDLTLTGTCADTGGSGCVKNATKPYSSNTNSTTESPGTVTDNAGNSATCPSNQTVRIDKTIPSCGTVTGASTAWIGIDRKVSVACSDSGGSGCYESPFSSTYSSTTQTSNIRIKDNAGNTKDCPVNVYVDKTAPNCGTVTGASTTWINGSRTISAACSDSNSGCSTGTFSKTYSTTTKTANITISDKVGNTKACPVNVYIDTTAPTCIFTGSATYNPVIYLTATGTDLESGLNLLDIYGPKGVNLSAVERTPLSNGIKGVIEVSDSIHSNPGTYTTQLKDNVGNAGKCTIVVTKTCDSCKTCTNADVCGYTAWSSWSFAGNYSSCPVDTTTINYSCSWNTSHTVCSCSKQTRKVATCTDQGCGCKVAYEYKTE